MTYLKNIVCAVIIISPFFVLAWAAADHASKNIDKTANVLQMNK